MSARVVRGSRRDLLLSLTAIVLVLGGIVWAALRSNRLHEGEMRATLALAAARQLQLTTRNLLSARRPFADLYQEWRLAHDNLIAELAALKAIADILEQSRAQAQAARAAAIGRGVSEDRRLIDTVDPTRLARLVGTSGLEAAYARVLSGDGVGLTDLHAAIQRLEDFDRRASELASELLAYTDDARASTRAATLLLGFSAFGVLTLLLAGLAFLLVRNHRLQTRLSRDLSARIAAEQALRDREEDLRTTLDSIGDAVIATNVDGRVTRLNPVAETLTGWTQEDAAGRPLAEVFRIVNAETRATVPNPVEQVLAAGTVVGLANHTVLIGRDGAEHHIADSAAPIRGEEGRVRGVVLVFRDVTDQHQLEARMRQAQKLEAMGRLAGGVAHDFNNLLAGMMGYAELLAAHCQDGERRAWAGKIVATAGRAADLARQMLAFTRQGARGAVPFDLHEAISAALDLLRRTVDRRIDVIADLGAANRTVRGDPALVQSAILNLGANSRDAMPAGGVFSVSTATVTLPSDPGAPSDLRPGPYVRIEARDSGHGMDAAVRGRLFEPFFTTKPKGQGTGLGLAAVHGTVLEMGGGIAVDSTPDQGTTFTIWLPVAVSAAVPLVPAAAIAPRGTGHILVVDDEPSLRDLAQHMLGGLGYTVETAVDGQDAVDRFTAGERYDLVVLDMVMPRLGGRDCLTALRRIDPGVRVILASGYAEAANETDGEAVHGVLAKPYALADLGNVVARSLRR